MTDTIVLGAGLAGLACAMHLSAAGREVTVVEATDGVGGRMRSDVVDGFVLDRGFQVLLTAYPEAKRVLDYAALDLRAYDPGALVQIEGKRHLVSDPFRDPTSLLSTFKAPIGSPIDKLRLLQLRRSLAATPFDELLTRPAMTTADRLRGLKFSSTMIDRFLRPLFAGTQLDPSLQASSQMFDLVFRMLAEGDGAVPARGMQAIPDQLASRLPAGSVRLHSPVRSVDDGAVTLHSGEVLRAKTIVIAVDGANAASLLDTPPPRFNAVTSFSFSAPKAPFDEKLLLLNGDGASAGPINNLAVPSSIAPNYAPPGSHLVVASVLGPDEPSLRERVTAQLGTWFGEEVAQWRHLRTDAIARALPASSGPMRVPVKVRDGLFACGDHRESPTIHGALVSGRRAADAILTA